ncbi:autoinducer binding domain-containing protein [Cribrihabitans sp. XS_ASV171]
MHARSHMPDGVAGAILAAAPNPQEVIACIGALGYAEQVETVWQDFLRIVARYGFDRVNYSYMPTLRDPERASRTTRFTLSSHPREGMAKVYASPLLDRSPMRIWATSNVGSMSWSQQPRLLRDYGMEADGPGLRELLHDLGVIAGYTVGFPRTAQSGKGTMGLTAQPGLDQAQVDEIWAARGPEIEALAVTAHNALSRMPLSVLDRPLSGTQREILGWIADGKTIQDVAILMERSVSSVEKNLAAVREVLGVETTAQAIARMALINQLRLPEDAGR